MSIKKSRRRKTLENGAKYGRLTVIRNLEVTSGESMSLFECDCGTQFESRNWNVTSGRTKSCGCHRREHAAAVARKYNYKEILGGTEFGLLKVIGPLDDHAPGYPDYQARCQCGKVIEARSNDLRTGHVWRCGIDCELSAGMTKGPALASSSTRA
ncbi:hypothetical protein [Ferrimonas marina]|uniref:Uncharacterized protein n=1 Tax=Ferrimonas marina TaxID=299255 RepID=A0A1M5UL06_9GAMM|nr:hypothetical protein [Ferrimonas marina]SHH63548.1 hypothetical protein SAMN02745129_2615 [Ferrimonas marina]